MRGDCSHLRPKPHSWRDTYGPSSSTAPPTTPALIGTEDADSGKPKTPAPQIPHHKGEARVRIFGGQLLRVQK